jgi:predicted amidohydrolase YtcJ
LERDCLYVGAKFLSMDRAPEGEAMLVRGDRIAAIGRTADAEAAAGPHARRVDLRGQTVIPGFNDSHAHLLWLGVSLSQLDVSVDAVAGIEDIKRLVAERAGDATETEWIVGRGYDQNALVERRHPTRFDLDQVGAGRPVVLRHTSGHVLTCSSRALQLAAVTEQTADPEGGQIDRDERGVPTGLMKESAMDLIMSRVPPPSVDEGAAAIVAATQTLARYGITSASDASTGDGESLDSALQMFTKAATSDRFATRLQLMPRIQYIAPPEREDVVQPRDIRVETDGRWLNIGPTKIFSDGALSTRTAALSVPYADDAGNRGMLLWPEQTLQSMILRAHKAGWQIATHALGDRAVETVVAAYGKAISAVPRNDHRHRIEHCMLLDKNLAIEMGRLGIIASLQPDIFRLGDGYLEALGRERASESIPIDLFRQARVTMAFSSDCPVIPSDPLPIIRSAVKRLTPGGVHLGSRHAAGVAEAIRHYTSGGAFATRTDDEKGKLRAGFLADFTVLSADPTAIPVEEFDSLHVTMTVVGGRETFAIQ